MTDILPNPVTHRASGNALASLADGETHRFIGDFSGGVGYVAKAFTKPTTFDMSQSSGCFTFTGLKNAILLRPNLVPSAAGVGINLIDCDNVVLLGAKAANASIRATRSTNITLQQCETVTRNFGLDNCAHVKFLANRTSGCVADSLFIQSSKDVLVDGFLVTDPIRTASSPHQDAVQMDGVDARGGPCEDITVQNSHFRGFYLQGVTYWQGTGRNIRVLNNFFVLGTKWFAGMTDLDGTEVRGNRSFAWLDPVGLGANGIDFRGSINAVQSDNLVNNTSQPLVALK